MSTNDALIFFKAASGTDSRILGDYVGADILNVKSFGAVGDGSHDDTSNIQTCIDTAFGTVGNATANKIVFFPPGTYKTTSALTTTNVSGATIVGSGMGVTIIQNTTSGSTVFATNGWHFSTIKHLSLVSAGGAGSICFDWNGPGGSAVDATFINVEFNGAAIGVKGTGQSSEALYLGCLFRNCSTSALAPQHGNSLNHVILGGRIQDGGIGVNNNQGSIPLVMGVYFSGNTNWDIQATTSTCPVVIGCYSSSVSFILLGGSGQICGCTHTGNGQFTSLNTGQIVIDGSYATNSVIAVSGAPPPDSIYLRNSQFDNINYLTGVSSCVKENI